MTLSLCFHNLATSHEQPRTLDVAVDRDTQLAAFCLSSIHHRPYPTPNQVSLAYRLLPDAAFKGNKKDSSHHHNEDAGVSHGKYSSTLRSIASLIRLVSCRTSSINLLSRTRKGGLVRNLHPQARSRLVGWHQPTTLKFECGAALPQASKVVSLTVLDFSPHHDTRYGKVIRRAEHGTDPTSLPQQTMVFPSHRGHPPRSRCFFLVV